jgi:predicted nucleic acid-binding protein
MRVVSDTSPLSNLAIIGRLDLLRQRYGEVLIPPIVAQELAALSHAGGKVEIEMVILAEAGEIP